MAAQYQDRETRLVKLLDIQSVPLGFCSSPTDSFILDPVVTTKRCSNLMVLALGRSAALYFFFGLALEQKHFALHVTSTVGPNDYEVGFSHWHPDISFCCGKMTLTLKLLSIQVCISFGYCIRS